mgnify:CR=1 FL=1
MMTLTCPRCSGRGWTWVGSIDNAEREECAICQGKGKEKIAMYKIVWLMLWLAMMGVMGWLIVSVVRH